LEDRCPSGGPRLQRVERSIHNRRCENLKSYIKNEAYVLLKAYAGMKLASYFEETNIIKLFEKKIFVEYLGLRKMKYEITAKQ
jgi:hypothetical protein